MTPRRTPAYRIYRFDAHPHEHRADSPHYRAYWVVGGRPFRMHYWGLPEWLCLREAERPQGTVPSGRSGHILVSPLFGRGPADPGRGGTASARDQTS